MAKLGISTGTTPNDGTGDSLLVGAIKVNSNFSEIYNRFGDGTNLTGLGGTWSTTTVGIHTLKNVGIGTTNPTSKLTVSGNATFSGVVTANSGFVGSLIGNVTGISSSALVSTYSSTSGISTYSSTSGISTYSSSAGVSTYSLISGISTYSSTSGISTYSSSAGVSTYSLISGISTYSSTSGVCTSVIGGPAVINYISSGIITTTRLFVDSDGIQVVGVLTVGTGPIIIDGTIGSSKISIGAATTIGRTESIISGVLRASSIGIGTTSPTESIDIIGGNIRVGVNTSNGLILTSPNGTKYRLVVANNGTLSTVAV